MSEKSEVPGTCPHCGGLFSTETTGGLCPKCLLGLAIDQLSDPLIGLVLGHYEVVEQLSAGGMGVVYKARDSRLGRFVAIKFIREEHADDMEALRRFKKEALALASLHHPHICPFLDFGEHEGKPYIVTEYLEGKNLKERLTDGPVPFKETLEIALKVADALRTAHARGFLHRDLKPANILLTSDGEPRLLDFGLTKTLHNKASQDPAAFEQTTGNFAGTIPYMSPEQLRAAELDQRSDLFSFGVVLYEMTAGRTPFERNSPAETIAAIQGEDPPPLTQLNRKTPNAFSRFVHKLLSKNPEKRYRDAEAALVDLRKMAARQPFDAAKRILTSAVAAVIATVAVLGLYVALSYIQGSGESTVRPVESIAVLPFRNLSANPELDPLSDGMADELIARLVQIEGLRVLPRSRTEIYRDQPVSADVMQSLGVDVLVEGSILRSTGPALIRINLIDSRQVLFTRSYEREGDIRQVINEIAQSVAEEIRSSLSPQEEERIATMGAEDEQARLDYWAGQYALNRRTPEAFQTAIDYFKRAIALSPEFAEAHAGIARAYGVWGSTGYAPGTRIDISEARSAAEEALRLNPNLAEAHSALGMILMAYEWQWEAAGVHFSRAFALKPDDAEGRHWYALYLAAQGDLDAALRQLTEARALDPRSPVIAAALGRLFYYRREFEDSERNYSVALDLEPNSMPSRQGLLILYLKQQRFPEALAEIQQGLLIPAVEGRSLLLEAFSHAIAGRFQEADAQVAVMQRSAGRIPATYLAVFYATFEQAEQTLYWLKQSVGERSDYLNFIQVDPLFDHIRQDPRYEELLQAIGFNPAKSNSPAAGSTGRPFPPRGE